MPPSAQSLQTSRLWHRTLWNNEEQQNPGGPGGTQLVPVSITTVDTNFTVIDSIYCNLFTYGDWMIQVDDIVGGTSRIEFKLTAAHNGIGSVLATDANWTVHNKIFVGPKFPLQVDCEIMPGAGSPFMLVKVQTIAGAKITQWRSLFKPQ